MPYIPSLGIFLLFLPYMAVSISFDELSVALSYVFLNAAVSAPSSSSSAKESKAAAPKTEKKEKVLLSLCIL